MALGKKINELVPYSDLDVAAGDLLVPMADPVTGIAGYGTIQQIVDAAGGGGGGGTYIKLKYVATGVEGPTLTIPTLSGKVILLLTREAGILYEVPSAPDSTEYTWDGSDIVLGLAPGAGERFNIIYGNP